MVVEGSLDRSRSGSRRVGKRSAREEGSGEVSVCLLAAGAAEFGPGSLGAFEPRAGISCPLHTSGAATSGEDS